MLMMAFSTFLATLGFAGIFNIRGDKLFFAALGGSVGGVAYYLSKDSSVFLNMLYTSMAISLYSEVMARYLKTPVTVFLIPALICYVPGGTLYYWMSAVLNNASNANALLSDAMASASALAIGIIMISTAVKLFYKIKRLGR